jgi:hypothetical protein
MTGLMRSDARQGRDEKKKGVALSPRPSSILLSALPAYL